MTYNQILVHVDAEPSAERRLKIAAGLAQQQNAQLVGIYLPTLRPGYVTVALDAPVSPGAFEAWIAEGDTHARRQDARARAIFDAEVAEFGLEAEWRSLDGAPLDVVVKAARMGDLLIAPGLSADETGNGSSTPADAVAMATGGPVLIVPKVGVETRVGERILMAWNGSKEAARTLRDALPLLQAAQTVTAVVIGHGDATRDAEAELGSYFTRHGLHGEVTRLPAESGDASEPLLRHAAAIGADLIVMGLYGHSRLQEYILGGASRRMLDHSPVPLFVSH